jgi:hypothetical protein
MVVKFTWLLVSFLARPQAILKQYTEHWAASSAFRSLLSTPRPDRAPLRVLYLSDANVIEHRMRK